MKIAILGRQSQLCQAELESLYQEVTHLSDHVSLVNTKKELDINRLGGTVKLASAFYDDEIETAKQLPILLADSIVNFINQQKPAQKISFGLSFYSKSASLGYGRALTNLGLTIKKSLRTKNIASRFVAPKNGQALSAAQVCFNRLDGQGGKGFDFVVVVDSKRLIVGITEAVQDVSAYARRDHDRPCRDMVVGMLPPKLAQILINLACPTKGQAIYDPFCGSGVVLQEALLAGYRAHGSDISTSMITCSQKNLTWLEQNYQLDQSFALACLDATSLNDCPPNCVIASEGYLGEPMAKPLNLQKINQQKEATTKLYLAFFKNLADLVNVPQRLTICLPVWQLGSQVVRLNIIDQIDKMGYTLEQFIGADSRNLIYLRENQLVGRQVLVLKRKA